MNVDDQDKTYRILALGYCGCRHNGGMNIKQEDHTCPYSEELNSDYVTMCNCCEECEYQCAQDI